jgi:hypothetical protein
VVASALAPVQVGAQTVPTNNANQGAGTTPPANTSTQLTGKERLGEKWKDEQRVDNCKVPLDKRGATPRPDNCAHAPPE